MADALGLVVESLEVHVSQSVQRKVVQSSFGRSQRYSQVSKVLVLDFSGDVSHGVERVHIFDSSEGQKLVHVVQFGHVFVYKSSKFLHEFRCHIFLVS